MFVLQNNHFGLRRKNQNLYIFIFIYMTESQEKKLIELIDNTESMDSIERGMWKGKLPSMTDSQKDRLFDILDTERRKLEEIKKAHEEATKEDDKRIKDEWENLKDYLE